MQRCWIAPRDVKPGAQYADAIVRAINEAKAVVVLVMSGECGGVIARGQGNRREPLLRIERSSPFGSTPRH